MNVLNSCASARVRLPNKSKVAWPIKPLTVQPIDNGLVGLLPNYGTAGPSQSTAEGRSELENLSPGGVIDWLFFKI